MYICLILYNRHVNFYSGIDMYYSNQIKINTHISVRSLLPDFTFSNRQCSGSRWRCHY